MNRILFLLTFLTESISLQAQEISNKHFILLRTHPVAWIIGDANVGLEFRHKLISQQHLTLSIFRVGNAFKILDVHEIDESTDENKSTYDPKGWTIRMGDKIFFNAERKTNRIYIEPQFRFGKLSKNANYSRNDQPYYLSVFEQQNRFQFLTLIGVQNRINKNFYVDYYIGIGFLRVHEKSTVFYAQDPSTFPLGSTTFQKFNDRPIYYLGTSLCFDFRKKENIIF